MMGVDTVTHAIRRAAPILLRPIVVTARTVLVVRLDRSTIAGSISQSLAIRVSNLNHTGGFGPLLKEQENEQQTNYGPPGYDSWYQCVYAS
jgi:hypothetical protein